MNIWSWLENLSPLEPLAGGMLAGLAAALLLFSTGELFGVSGILGGLLSPVKGEWRWRAALIAGLIYGGFVLHNALPFAFDAIAPRSDALMIAGGLLVGFGARVARGCTSGHGLCGVARLSPRSIVAMIVFIATGIATVAIIGGVS